MKREGETKRKNTLKYYITTQHEFCFLACTPAFWSGMTVRTEGQGTNLLVKRLARSGQIVAAVDERVELLAALQHALDGLVQHNLGLV